MRSAAVHQPEHRRVSPAQGVPKAQREVAHTALTPNVLVVRARAAAVVKTGGAAGSQAKRTTGYAQPPRPASGRRQQQIVLLNRSEYLLRP